VTARKSRQSEPFRVNTTSTAVDRELYRQWQGIQARRQASIGGKRIRTVTLNEILADMLRLWAESHPEEAPPAAPGESVFRSMDERRDS
jgi:hypothetical protein